MFLKQLQNLCYEMLIVIRITMRIPNILCFQKIMTSEKLKLFNVPPLSKTVLYKVFYNVRIILIFIKSQKKLPCMFINIALTFCVLYDLLEMLNNKNQNLEMRIITKHIIKEKKRSFKKRINDNLWKHTTTCR